MSTMIRHGQGAQTIRWVPVDEHGIPRRITSATYSIADLREALETSRRTVVASTAATASSVSTTTTAAAGPSTANPRLVTLTSVTGVRTGGVYLLSHPTAPTVEAITVANVNASALQIETTRSVTRVFPVGSTFVGLELEATFPADVAADDTRLDHGGGPFCITWQYTLGGQLYVAPLDLWLTRYGIAPWVRADEVYRHLPGLAGNTGGESVSPEEAIAAATDDLFEALAANATSLRDPAYFRGNLSASAYVRKRAIVYMLRGARNADALALAQVYDDEARGHLNNLTEGRPPARSVAVHPYDDTAESGGSKRAVSWFARS